jgi:hypothetical protein
MFSCSNPTGRLLMHRMQEDLLQHLAAAAAAAAA